MPNHCGRIGAPAPIRGSMLADEAKFWETGLRDTMVQVRHDQLLAVIDEMEGHRAQAGVSVA